MSYYDVDAILADAQKVPATFELDVPQLGFLDGNVGEDVKAGSRMEIPLWLAEVLAVGARAGSAPFVSLDFPKALSGPVTNALKADPRSVDLRTLSPHFYKLGVRILQLFEEEEMIHVLSDTFKKRSIQISDHATNTTEAMGGGVEFLRGLDETERQLFRAVHDRVKEVRSWAGETRR